MPIGSARDPGKVTLQWEMFFWHPTELSDKGRPVERDKAMHDGFERITGSGQKVSVAVRDGETDVFTTTTRSHQVLLDPLPEGRLTVHLTPSDALSSAARAGPHLDSKGGKFNKFFDVMFRPVAFEIDVDADGEVTGPAPGSLTPVRDAAPEPVPGVPRRPAPAPHAYVFVERPLRKRGRLRSQAILVDWKPDWISRIHPLPRPTPVGRGANDVREIVLHITDGPLIVGAIQKFLAPKSRKGKVLENGIHYIVDIDGHVVKMLHERHGTFHAGFKPGKKPSHLAAWGEGERAAKVAKTSVGIEHAAAPDVEWPEAQVVASVDLVRQLANHFGVQPRDVVGHNDVIVRISSRALPQPTKPCPAGGLPWERYQRAGLSLAAKTTFDPPDDIYGGIFERQKFLDDTAPEAVIQELQEDLHRIGWWLPTKRGGRRRLGTFDESTEAGVLRFQARFMARQGLTFSKGKVDLATARRVKRVLAALD